MTIVKAFAEIDSDRDGWISRTDAARSGARFEQAFLDTLERIKLPDESQDSSTPNSESWIDNGIVGWMTGGRPLLPSRPPDPYRGDAIDVAKLEHTGTVLRFKAKQVAGDDDRQFIVGFYPEDDTIAVWEIPVRNSGLPAGKFAERGIKPKPKATES
ncbi:hypothetical protein C9890_0541, partial [Perkinsus sp. BL_2016]